MGEASELGELMPRRWTLALTGLALTGLTACGAAQAGPTTAVRVAAARHTAGWQLKWSPRASVSGLNAFEGVENRGRTKEIYVQGNDYHVGMNVVDRDGTDRQRNEVKGMRTPAGQIISIGKGETWRFTYSMYLPSSLRATTSFAHIMQMKMPGVGSSPIATLDLRRHGAASMLQLVVFKTNTVIGSTNLLPLQNKWINIDVRFRYDDAPRGWAQIIVNNGKKNVLNAQKSGVDTWLGDRVRPKWGIYRSINDMADLRNTYLLLTEMRGYRLQ